MAKLLFDPITYQFYYRCRSEESAPAKAAGFGWDPIRRRFYTENPLVASNLASRGDSYVKHLLADVLEDPAVDTPTQAAGVPRKQAPEHAHFSTASNSIH
jgi:hypothetical protein